MKIALGHAVNITQLFSKFKLSKLHIKSTECADYSTFGKNREKLVRALFIDALRIITDDIIDNNATFFLPTNPRQSWIYMRRVKGNDFKFARQHGKFEDFDLFASDFSGYQLSFRYKTRETYKEKPIYVDKKHKKAISDNVNNGKLYY